MLKKYLLIILCFFFCFVSVGQCDYINNYPPDSPWILNPEGVRVLKVDPDGSTRVRNQDQTTPPFILQAHKSLVETTLTAATAKEDKIINVVSTSGMLAGNYVAMFSTVTDRFYNGTILSVTSTTITVDTPVDSVFSIGDIVDTGSSNMNVDGSTTTQVFSLRGGDPGVNIAGDVTRMMITMITDTAPAYDKFGDIAGGLTNGLVMRVVRANGTILNIFNIKSNGKIASISYDTAIFDPSNPSGVYGITSRLTFGGPSKFGVVIRVDIGDDVELLVQDDLRSLIEFKITFEGSIVIP